MIVTLILTAFQTIPDVTGIPAGSGISAIGKAKPATFTAIRDYHSLPKIGEMGASQRLVYSGSVITLDYPQPGDIHVLNYQKGKRVVLDNPKQKTTENGVPLTKMLLTMPKKIDIRFANPTFIGFDVRLPGQEKKLAGFSGTLTVFAMKKGERGMAITVKNGKVASSRWLKDPGLHK